MSDQFVIAAIRRSHLKHGYDGRLYWSRAYVDGLGHAPYLHVPVRSGRERIVIRIYPTARLGRQLIKRFGYRWGKTWRTEPGPPLGWPAVSPTLKESPE